MKDFTKSVPFQGDAAKAMNAAAAVLMPHGYRVTCRSERTIEFEGPAFVYQQRSPYWGASHCRLNAEGGRLELEVHMDRWRNSNRLGALIGGAMICIIGFMLAIFAVANPHDGLLVLLLLSGFSGFVALLIYGLALPQMRARTNEAFETLLKNAAMMGAPKS